MDKNIVWSFAHQGLNLTYNSIKYFYEQLLLLLSAFKAVKTASLT